MVDKKAAAALALKERSRGKRFKLSEGDTTFRVLPNAQDVEQAEFVEYGMHSEVGPRKAYLRCGKSKSGKGACFLCDEMIPKLQSSGKASHSQVAERMARKDVFAVQIAYLDPSTDSWVGPVLWETPNSVSQSLLSIMQRRNISDPEKGYNLLINRVGTTMKDTRYQAVERDEEPSEADEAVMSKLKPFKEVVRKYDEGKMKAAYYGHDQEEDEATLDEEETIPRKQAVDVDDDEVAVPVSKNGSSSNGRKKVVPIVADDEEVPTPKSARKAAAVENSDGDDDAELAALAEFEDEVPDLEEEDAPKPKAGKKQAAVVEEEEEAPAPKASKKVAVKKAAAVEDVDDDF